MASNAVVSLSATSAQAICGLSLSSASVRALSRTGFALSAAGDPKSTSAIAAVPRTAWSGLASPLIIDGMLAWSFAHAR
jgi:hypothetical protein